jgi:hypothetical protein
MNTRAKSQINYNYNEINEINEINESVVNETNESEYQEENVVNEFMKKYGHLPMESFRIAWEQKKKQLIKEKIQKLRELKEDPNYVCSDDEDSVDSVDSVDTEVSIDSIDDMEIDDNDSDIISIHSEYEVTKILAVNYNYNYTDKTKFYLLRWANGEKTWEPEYNLTNCSELLIEFESKLKILNRHIKI